MRIALSLIVASGCVTIDDGFALEISARDAPVVVVQDGEGAWERIATTPDGTAYVQIHEASYGVGALCGDQLWKSASFLFDTQPRTVFLTCPASIPSAGAFHVRGTTEPMATVWLDGNSVRADAAGGFDLPLYEQGLHDVVAILPTQPPKIVAQRAIVIAGDTIVDLPAIDAVEMAAFYPRVAGEPDESDAVVLSSDLNTGTDWISFGSSSSTVYLPPATFLLPTDRAAIAARSRGCTRQHPLATANEPFELPVPLAYTLDRAQIEWTADPTVAWDTALLEITSFVGGSDYRAFSSASWRDVTGRSSIPVVDLAALPGWSDGFARIEPDKPASFSFYMSRGTYDGDLTSCSANDDLERW